MLESSARLVAAGAAAGRRARATGELDAALGSVLRARGKRYLMANVPRGRLPRCARRSVLPGLNGPTVSSVLDGGSLRRRARGGRADRSIDTIADLKALGARASSSPASRGMP